MFLCQNTGRNTRNVHRANGNLVTCVEVNTALNGIHYYQIQIYNRNQEIRSVELVSDLYSRFSRYLSATLRQGKLCHSINVLFRSRPQFDIHHSNIRTSIDDTKQK